MALSSSAQRSISSCRSFRRYLSSNSHSGVPIEERSELKLWVWGKGEVGQLGVGDEETRRSPAAIHCMALPNSVVLATTQGCLTGTPSADRIQFMRGNDQADNASTRHVSAEQDRKVGIACGLFHSGLWTSGNVWLWGKGGGGRLGLGSEQSQYSPTQLSGLTDVKSLALGGLHSVAVTNGGSLYTWGFGGFGALGHGSYTKEMSPRRLIGEDWMDNVVHVSAGGSHTAAITSSGELYTWGRDEGEGRLGHGWAVETDDGAVSTPVKVQELNVPVSAVACGGFCTMSLTPDGQLWSWGGNSNYELGRGDRRDDWRPKPIPALENTQIVQVACGGYHAAALTDGKVLTWGHGGHGQLGHGGLENTKVPSVVERLGNQRVVSIACGGAWTAAVTESGELYTWGKNRDSQLGIPGLMDTQMTPALVETGVESKPESMRVIGVCAGSTHGMCLVRRGKT
ncbi:hypothetical protein Mapa_005951 [Marchantia paleacea]|nr:hypothetical protein Mapa_005951 [Marchantia paleacea]